MKLFALLACLLGLLITLPAHASETEDVLGRQVPLGEGRPALVLYANRHSRQVLKEHIYPFAYALREQRPIVVVRVDLRDVPGLFRGKARKELRRIHHESLELMREMFRQNGEEPPVELESSLFMVADSQGLPHRELRLEKGFGQVLAQAVGPSGETLARGPFPQSSALLERALEERPAPQTASASRVGRGGS